VQPVVTMLIQGVSAMIPLVIPSAARNLLYTRPYDRTRITAM
jgi:hypothetical protein